MMATTKLDYFGIISLSFIVFLRSKYRMDIFLSGML